MSEPTRTELFQLIARIEHDVKLLKQTVNQIKPEKEWLSTAEFADRAGLSHRTVSNYASRGDFNRCRKDSKGHWQIHKSELP